MEDYRLSHLEPGKGRSYHRAFTDNPYRAMVWSLEQQVLCNILASGYVSQPIRLLDFACGTGRILGFLEGKVSEATGVDISDSMLDVARKHISSAEIIKADLTRQDVLRDRTFNLITAFRFFANAQPELRREAMRVLQSHLEPNGCLVFNNHRNRGNLTDHLTGPIWPIKYHERMGHDEVIALLEDADMKIVAKYHIGLLPFIESRPLLPCSWLAPLERCFMSLHSELLCRLSQNIIYVCART